MGNFLWSSQNVIDQDDKNPEEDTSYDSEKKLEYTEKDLDGIYSRIQHQITTNMSHDFPIFADYSLKVKLTVIRHPSQLSLHNIKHLKVFNMENEVRKAHEQKIEMKQHHLDSYDIAFKLVLYFLLFLSLVWL